jgi:AI-2 transport protein TqsA
MNERFRALVYGSILALIIGWVLFIGKSVFVPIVFGILVVYVIVGLTRLLGRLSIQGRVLPLRLRHAVSVLVILSGLVGVTLVLVANTDGIAARAPEYQRSLLGAIQQGAVRLGIEHEPTWATLRADLLPEGSVRRLIGAMVASVSSILATVVVVLLYASFFLIEQEAFAEKLTHISSDPVRTARIRQITDDINRRVGAYLAVKTGVCALLGLVSWAAMALLGLDFALFLGLLIALLNYIPYVGSFLGVAFPVLMAVVQFGDPAVVLAVLAVLTVIQFVIGNFLDPYLMGNSLNLSPFAILMSLAMWSQIWGIAGAFVAVPITAILAIVLSEFAGTKPIAVLLSRRGRL